MPIRRGMSRVLGRSACRTSLGLVEVFWGITLNEGNGLGQNHTVPLLHAFHIIFHAHFFRSGMRRRFSFG